MKILHYSCLLAILAVFGLIAPSFADETPKETKRARSLLATPVNVNTAGAGSLPKGMALTMINASFANKTRSKRGGGGRADVFQQSWLLKIRYGITNRFEIATTVPWIHMTNSNRPDNTRKYVEGFGDSVLQFTVAPLQQHQGDPLSFSLTGGILFPTGQTGDAHLPGNNAWGGRAAAAVGAFVTKDIKLDTEVVWSGPFERGNQNVERGDQWQWNSNIRYLWDWFDVGFESSLVVQESGDRKIDGVRLADGSWQRSQTVNTRNGYKEWFIGPSMNFAVDSVGMWAGVGAFFPVMQDYKEPAKVENMRVEFKLGKVW